MHQPSSNIRLLIASTDATVAHLPRAPGLLLAAFPNQSVTSEDCTAVDVVLGGKARKHRAGIGARVYTKLSGTPLRCRKDRACFALLPNVHSPRLAVRLDEPALFRRGLSIYRPGRPWKSRVVQLLRQLGPMAFAGPVLELTGRGIRDSPVERIVRAYDPGARIAGIFFGSQGETNTCTVVLSIRDSIVFAKVATGAHSEHFVNAEAQRLRDFAARPLKSARVPRLLRSERIDGMPVNYVEVVLGPGARQLGTNLERASELLVELHSWERSVSSLPECALGQRIADRLSKVPGASELASAWRLATKWLNDVRLPLGLAHGDFVPWNILVEGDELAVVDWEWSQVGVPPGIDLAHFIYQSEQNLGLRVDDVAGASGPIARHLARFGLPPQWARPVCAAYLVDWILFELVEGGKTREDLSFHLHELRQLTT